MPPKLNDDTPKEKAAKRAADKKKERASAPKKHKAKKSIIEAFAAQLDDKQRAEMIAALLKDSAKK